MREPSLPYRFRWVIAGRLAGMARPGLHGDLASELAALHAAGVRLLVSLDPAPLPGAPLVTADLRVVHVPIPSMAVPSLAACAEVCRAIDAAVAADEPVAVHCRAGEVRTGLILAAALVWRGATPAEAFAALREADPEAVEGPHTRGFVEHFAQVLPALRRAPDPP